MIIETRGDVIKLRGALEENQWLAIKSAVSLLLNEHPEGVIIDASNLSRVTEAGARTFLDASNYIQAHNARVVVAGMPPDILEEIRKIPGVRSQLVVASSVEEARASLETGGMAPLPEAKRGPVVLVPLVGAWNRAIQFAATEAASRRAELHLLYVLQIPRNLPLGVPVPEMEHDAQRVLTEAEQSLKRRGVTVRKLTTRAREVFEGISRLAEEARPDLVVIAFSKEELARDAGRFASIRALCADICCDVAVYCVTR